MIFKANALLKASIWKQKCELKIDEWKMNASIRKEIREAFRDNDVSIYYYFQGFSLTKAHVEIINKIKKKYEQKGYKVEVFSPTSNLFNLRLFISWAKEEN